jgi:hypothetical protein
MLTYGSDNNQIFGVMKKILTLSLLLFFGLLVFPQSSQEHNSSAFSILSETQNSVTLQFELPSWYLEDAHVKGLKNAKTIQCGVTGVTLEEGAPELPHFSTSLRINGTDPRAEIVNSEYFEIENVVIAPSPGLGERGTDKRKRKVNPEAYNQNNFYPATLISNSNPFTFRDVNGVSVNITPFSYNPVTKILRVYKKFEVKLSFQPGNNAAERVKSSRDFESLHGKLFLNHAGGNRDVKGYEVPQMMIVAPKEYFAACEPFRKWKNQKGIKTTMVDIAQFSNEYELRDYVKQQFLDNGLMFLVLVGDADRVPTFTVENGYSDMMYGYLEGDDHFPDVFVGRISADNSTGIASQLQRFIDYEKNPFTGRDWFSDVIGVASKSGPGHNNEMDFQHIRNIQQRLLNATYRNAIENFDGSQGGNDPEGDVLTEGLLNQLNNGAGAVFYAGHAAEEYWFTSGLGVDHIDELRNEEMLPVFFSVACHSGNFVDGTCLGEALLNGNNNGVPVGASGAFMSSGSISWVAPMHAQDAMAELMADEKSGNTVGAIAAGGCAKMNEVYFWAGDKITDTWVLFGDPSLEFRSTYPAGLEVIHPEEISYLSEEITVIVIAQQAVITLSKDGEIISSVVAENGAAILPVINQLAKNATYDIVVSAANRIPYVSTITTSDLPGNISSENPVNKSNMVSVVPEFAWHCDGECEGVSYRLFLGTNNPPTDLLNGIIVENQSYSPGIVLQQNATFFWRVDAIYGDKVIEGEVWEFSTLPDPDEDFEHFYDEGKMAPLNLGNPSWLVETDNPFRGVYSARSNKLNQGEECVMELTCSLESSDFVGFWVNLKGESGDGEFQFFANDENLITLDDDTGWSWLEFALDPGQYTLVWRYVKNAAENVEAVAWIDDIYIPGNREVYSFAGDDFTVCMQDHPVLNAVAEAWTSIQWSTEGDGGFNDAKTLSPQYFPGPYDLSRGSVNLTVTVRNDKTMTEVSDEVTIHFSRPPEVKIKVNSQ